MLIFPSQPKKMFLTTVFGAIYTRETAAGVFWKVLCHCCLGPSRRIVKVPFKSVWDKEVHLDAAGVTSMLVTELQAGIFPETGSKYSLI